MGKNSSSKSSSASTSSSSSQSTPLHVSYKSVFGNTSSRNGDRISQSTSTVSTPAPIYDDYRYTSSDIRQSTPSKVVSSVKSNNSTTSTPIYDDYRYTSSDIRQSTPSKIISSVKSNNSTTSTPSYLFDPFGGPQPSLGLKSSNPNYGNDNFNTQSSFSSISSYNPPRNNSNSSFGSYNPPRNNSNSSFGFSTMPNITNQNNAYQNDLIDFTGPVHMPIRNGVGSIGSSDRYVTTYFPEESYAVTEKNSGLRDVQEFKSSTGNDHQVCNEKTIRLGKIFGLNPTLLKMCEETKDSTLLKDQVFHRTLMTQINNILKKSNSPFETDVTNAVIHFLDEPYTTVEDLRQFEKEMTEEVRKYKNGEMAVVPYNKDPAQGKKAKVSDQKYCKVYEKGQKTILLTQDGDDIIIE